MSGRVYHRAVTPPEAWNDGREPRETTANADARSTT